MSCRCNQCSYPSCDCSVPLPGCKPQPLLILRRPLLVSATLAVWRDGWLVIVDNEQTPEEQNRALCHELAHLLGIEDEKKAEDIGLRLAAAVPELLELVAKQ